MTFIRFDVKNVRDYLLNTKHVYTLRSYNNYPSECQAIQQTPNEIIKLGYVKVIKVNKINHKEDLASYVSDSGFSTVDDWWGIAKQLHKSENLTLYLVKFLE
jgi:hypothetical protein